MDILLVSETKSDYTFPNGQFLIKDCSSPFRLERNNHGGGIMIYFYIYRRHAFEVNKLWKITVIFRNKFEKTKIFNELLL